jgi:hypothetical protein
MPYMAIWRSSVGGDSHIDKLKSALNYYGYNKSLSAFFPSPQGITQKDDFERSDCLSQDSNMVISASAEFFTQFFGSCPLRGQLPKNWVSNCFCTST